MCIRDREKGVSPFPSHRTVRDSLPSYGSSNLIYKYKLILFQVGKLYFKLANPFAPLPLQEFHHYYELVRPSTLHCYSASRVYLLCLSLNINVTGSRVP